MSQEFINKNDEKLHRWFRDVIRNLQLNHNQEKSIKKQLFLAGKIKAFEDILLMLQAKKY